MKAGSEYQIIRSAICALALATATILAEQPDKGGRYVESTGDIATFSVVGPEAKMMRDSPFLLIVR